MRPALVVAALALAACGPPTTDARRLWLDVPVDGTRILTDKQPKPF